MLGRWITLLIGFPTLVSRVPVHPPPCSLRVIFIYFFIFGQDFPLLAEWSAQYVANTLWPPSRGWCWFRWRPYTLLPMNMDGIRALLLQMSRCTPCGHCPRSWLILDLVSSFLWKKRKLLCLILGIFFFDGHQSAEGRGTDSPPGRVTRLVASPHHHSMFTSARCLSLRKNVKLPQQKINPAFHQNFGLSRCTLVPFSLQ